MEEITLVLPNDLGTRRELLESELRKVAYAIIEKDLVPQIAEILQKVSMPSINYLSWEFHPESDDEGGTAWHISGIEAHGHEGVVDLEEFYYEKESYRKDGSTYRRYIEEEIIDTLWDYKQDLYTYGVTELHLK